MAIVRLTSSEASLAAIAADLGFTDSTAFQRAFKVWTGTRREPTVPARAPSSTYIEVSDHFSLAAEDRRLHGYRAVACFGRGSCALKRLLTAVGVAPTAAQ